MPRKLPFDTGEHLYDICGQHLHLVVLLYYILGIPWKSRGFAAVQPMVLCVNYFCVAKCPRRILEDCKLKHINMIKTLLLQD